MRILIVSAASVVFSAAAIAACSSPPAQQQGLGGQDPIPEGNGEVAPTPNPGATPPSAPPQGGACSLQTSGISFASTACSDCMQTSCCAETVACFSANQKDCIELHKCILACPVPNRDGGGGGGGGGGGDGGRDGGGGGTGAGATLCRDACYAQHPNSATAEKAYNTCFSTKCTTQCATK